MTWFQKLLIAIPYLLYAGFFYLIYSGSGTITFSEVIIFIFVTGFVFIAIPALVGFFIHLAFYQNISFTGGFIITHWVFLFVFFSYLLYGFVASRLSHKVTIVEHEYQQVYTGDKLKIEHIAKDYVRNTHLNGQSHVFYFIKIQRDTILPGNYFAWYFYNLYRESDTLKAAVVKMHVNLNGNVAFTETLKLSEDETANRMFQSNYGFYQWLHKITDAGRGNADTVLSLAVSDSANLSKWVKELEMDETEFLKK